MSGKIPIRVSCKFFRFCFGQTGKETETKVTGKQHMMILVLEHCFKNVHPSLCSCFSSCFILSVPLRVCHSSHPCTHLTFFVPFIPFHHFLACVLPHFVVSILFIFFSFVSLSCLQPPFCLSFFLSLSLCVLLTLNSYALNHFLYCFLYLSSFCSFSFPSFCPTSFHIFSFFWLQITWLKHIHP